MTSGPATDQLLRPLNGRRIGGRDIGQVARTSARMIMSHDLPGLAADITYHSTLTMLPFLLFIVSLPLVVGNILGLSDPGQQVADKVGAIFSEDLGSSIQALMGEVQASRSWTGLLLGLAGTLWAGSATVSTIRKALNRIHAVEEDCPFWRKKGIELLLTLVAGAMALSAAVAAVAGPAIVGLSGWVSNAFFLAYAIGAAFMTVTLIYWLAPAGNGHLRWVTPGAVLFVLVWLVFTLGFSFYISNVGNMNHVYGTLGVMLIVITWSYWSALALLAGAEVNAVLTEHTDSPGILNGEGSR